MLEMIQTFLQSMGFMGLQWGQAVMIGIAFLLFYLGIKKGFEPLLLLPIAFGMFLANLPFAGMMNAGTGGVNGEAGGLLWYFYMGNRLGIWPPIVFAGIGAMIDFGPLIADPKALLLGAAAQFGIFATFFGAIMLGFSGQEAGAIGIIGGASGPISIWLANMLAPHLLGAIAIAAYSYMALVPIIQPPIMKALTTEKERKIKMEQLRPVSRTEKILFPILVTLVVSLIVPPAATLIGMLMLGNLLKESLVVERLKATVSNALMNMVMLFLGLAVGATASADKFLTLQTIMIILLGLVAFAVGTASGVLVDKLMNKISGGKVNPLIGSAGVSAIPMSARVSQKLGQEANPSNFLLMHAMGPNVAGAIGAAVVAGVMLALFG
jgi:carboxybiotin decarboxylase